MKERAWRDDCEILPLNLQPSSAGMSGDGKKSRLRLAPISLVHSAATERDCLRAWCEGESGLTRGHRFGLPILFRIY